MTKTKMIVVTLVALLVLSMFSGFAEGKARKHPNDPVTVQSVAISNDALPVERESRKYSIGSINSCKDAKLRRGDILSFTLDGEKYTIRQGLVGNRYAQLSFQGADSRFYSGDAKRYDLDLDGSDDLQIAAYELLNSNAYLAICGLEHKGQDVAFEAAVSEQETLSFLDAAYAKIRSWFN